MLISKTYLCNYHTLGGQKNATTGVLGVNALKKGQRKGLLDGGRESINWL